jgi:colanic acid/amylovoran biosynthesis glycosyltransferase
VYFKTSENWIHTQLSMLEDHRPIVLTEHTRNLDGAEWRPDIHAVYEQSRVSTLADRLGKKLFNVYPSYAWQAWWNEVVALHAHFGMLGYRLLPIARLLDVPLVTTFYGFDLSRLPQQKPVWQDRYQRLFAEGTTFLTEGPHMADQLADLGCPSDKIRVHHLGVDPTVYEFEPRRPNDGLRVLMVGRFTEKKGMRYGLQGFGRYCKRGGTGQLTIIGDSTRAATKPIKEKLQDIARRHGLESRVDFQGFRPVEALRQEYYRHHVLLVPSVQASDGDNEGGAPVSVLEAAATGMPAVGSNHCDIPEVVRDGDTGIIVDERDAEGIAQALAQLQASPAQVEAMGRAARLRVETHYDARKQGRRLDEIYEAIQTRRAAPRA